MQIKNVKIYGLNESIIRSGYPMQIEEPEDLNNNFYNSTMSIDSDSKDLKRAKKLAKVPLRTGHDNYLKGIIVQFDLQYPEYFSPQLQRYNWIDIISSQSKMHKITSRELTKNDFTDATYTSILKDLNTLINVYKASDSKVEKDACFKQLISNLPSGYLKWMGISTNYLQLKSIYNQRKNHKLEEWRYFCKWIETLPYSKELITIKK